MKTVVKSSGITQAFEQNKILKVLLWAVQGTSISAHDLLDMCLSGLTDNMSTSDIQTYLIKTSADLISLEEPDYQIVAGRLGLFGLRKKVYGQFEPISFYELITKNVELGVYDKELLEKWTKEDIDEFDGFIDHDKDLTYEHAAISQFIGKYMVQNRSTGEIYETPQFAYMLIGMCLHQDEPKDKRIQYVKDFYQQTSDKILSLPTPILAGVRTPTRQFSSCVVIEAGDSLESINESSSAIVDYISKRAGIGINAGRIRAEGSKVRSGEVKHTGVIPFWKHFQTAVKSCSQGGIRGGAANLNYPMWHLEFENIIVLKNNKGIDDNRIRQLDYTAQYNGLMIERLMNDEYITFFSPDVANGKLYDYFFEDEEKFKELYESLEKDFSVKKKRIKAVDAFSMMLTERANTGRIYLADVSNINSNSAFLDAIRMTNLCVEIAIPTDPIMKDITNSEIGLCTLMAINLGMINSFDEFQKTARVGVRALDNLLDYQDYPVDAALKAKLRRSLGFGITNLAYFLAKNFVKYSDGSALELIHEMMEAFQFYLLSASNELAQERGACGYFDRTTYSKGILPIDRYKKTVDELVEPVYKMDWESLRADIKKYGLRNSTLSAFMPCESSSQITNSTNGIEPPRALLSVKQSKDGVLNQLVPDVALLADEYELAWDMARNGMSGYLHICAVMQKFIDQSISLNTYYDPYGFKDDKVPMEVLLFDMILMHYYGIKTAYYHNTRDGADGSETTVEESADCAGCKV